MGKAHLRRTVAEFVAYYHVRGLVTYYTVFVIER